MDETKLLTPDDEEVKERIARKYRVVMTKRQLEKKMKVLGLKKNGDSIT